jgi:hypothetical protein
VITRRGRDHLIRVGFVMISNVTYFLGLAALPLADAVAIAFIALSRTGFRLSSVFFRIARN